MKKFILLMLVIASYGIQAQQLNREDKLLLKYDKEYLEQLQANNPKKYDFHILELEKSFEFVVLEEGVEYPALTPYDFHKQEEKAAPFVTNVLSFCLFNYTFDRHPTKDIIYKIPNSQKWDFGIKILSKERFSKIL